MELICTVEIMNRLAQSTGYGSKSKLGRPCKGVVQLRNKANGRLFLLVSTGKDVTGREYDVQSISILRTRFVKDGLATIEVNNPPMNIMLRDCNPEELRGFINNIQASRGKASSAVSNTEVDQKVGGSPLKTQEENKQSGTKTAVSLRKGGGGFKRLRSPDLSKTEIAKVKKCLLTNNKVLNVMKRENYPKRFLSVVEKIKIQGIGLKTLDKRILRLKWLSTLDLTGNRLTSIDELSKLNAPLNTLILANNEIENLAWDIFSHPTFSKLSYLDLSNNKLTVLPVSTLDVHTLTYFNVSGNKLMCLPYNWMNMKKLQFLNVSNNQIGFIPGPLCVLQLPKLDLSANPQLHILSNKTPDYVGYSGIPTLFDLVAEKVATVNRQKRLLSYEGLPNIIQYYMKGCKLCLTCGRMTLKYKILKYLSTPRSLAIETTTSQGSVNITVKLIVCIECDQNNLDPRAVLSF